MGPPFVGQGGGKADPTCAPWKLPPGAAGWQTACPANDSRPFWYESLSGVRDLYGRSDFKLLEPGIGYVRITNFAGKTDAELEAAYQASGYAGVENALATSDALEMT